MWCSHLVLTMSPAPRGLIQLYKTTPAHHILSSRTPRNHVGANKKGCHKNRPTLWDGGVYRSWRARTPPPDGTPGIPDSARSVCSFWPLWGPGVERFSPYVLVGPYVPPGGRRMPPRLKTTSPFGRARALTAHFVWASGMIQTPKRIFTRRLMPQNYDFGHVSNLPPTGTITRPNSF